MIDHLTPIEHLRLDFRTLQLLQRNRICTLGDLLREMDTDFSFVHGVGAKTLARVRDAISDLDIADVSRVETGRLREIGLALEDARVLADHGIGVVAGESDLDQNALSRAELLILPWETQQRVLRIADEDSALIRLLGDEKGSMNVLVPSDKLRRILLLNIRDLPNLQRLCEISQPDAADMSVSDFLDMANCAIQREETEAAANWINALRWDLLAHLTVNDRLLGYVVPSLRDLGIEPPSDSSLGELLRLLAHASTSVTRNAECWISLRCPLDGAPSTNAEIAELFSITKQRVYQICRSMDAHVEMLLRVILDGPTVGGGLIQPWFAATVGQAKSDLCDTANPVGEETVASLLGIPVGRGKQSALRLVCEVLDLSRVTVPSRARSKSGPEAYWVNTSLPVPELEAASAVVADVLREAVVPVQGDDLLDAVCDRAGVSQATASLALLLCPLAIPSGVGGSYEIEMSSLSRLADKAFRVLYSSGQPMRPEHIADEIEKMQISATHVNPRSIAGQLGTDSRFSCIGRKGIWSLAEWSIEGRSVEALAASAIEDNGGPVPLAVLQREILGKRPDLKDSSVVMILGNSESFIMDEQKQVSLVSPANPKPVRRKRSSTREKIDIRSLNKQVLDALGNSTLRGDISSRPLRVEVGPPLAIDFAVYAYALGGRSGNHGKTTYRLQMILPEQKRGEMGRYTVSDTERPILAGCIYERSIFVLWDAFLHEGKRYAFTLTVSHDSVLQALGGEVVTVPRHGRDECETVVICHADSLVKGLATRLEATSERLTTRHEP